MKQQTKFSEKQEQIVEQRSQHQALREFAGSDELLRFDAAQVAVPPEIEQRLQKSAEQVTPPVARRWWRNFFGR
jgi:hypothetical protein